MGDRQNDFMKQVSAILMIAAMVCAGHAAEDQATPAAAARRFYSELQGRKVRGLSQNKDWDAVLQFMTPDLSASFLRAQAEQADFIKRHPDEKPPWIDGDLFSSLFEGPQQFTPGRATVKGSTALVPMAFTYTEGGNTTKWTDTLELAKTEKGWLVEDLHYGGGWDFSNKGTLSDALAPEPSLTSPDGRFEFKAFTDAEANAGKPPFGIVEKITGKLIWSAPDDLGDASRPEETILWSPNSKRFALTSRVGTRHLACFIFGWQDTTFVAIPWDLGPLEELADLRMAACARADGFTRKASYGRFITDDTRPVRWVDNDSLVATRLIERSIAEGDNEGSVGGMARVLVVWNSNDKTFSIARDLGLPLKR
jgi:hypothetical protein